MVPLPLETLISVFVPMSDNAFDTKQSQDKLILALAETIAQALGPPGHSSHTSIGV